MANVRTNLASYSFLGASLQMLPFPWLPEYAAKRVRGALIHEMCARKAFTLTPEARDILAAPFTLRGPVGKALAPFIDFGLARFATRLTPFAFLMPLLAAGNTFLLGHLSARWLARPRPVGSTRIDALEAEKVRTAMERCIWEAFKHLETESPWRDLPQAPEELRSPREQIFDGFLMAAASIPPWLLARMEKGFDSAMENDQ